MTWVLASCKTVLVCSAWVFHCSRWDSAFSEARLFPEDVPEHVTAAVEKESKETEAQEAAEKLRLDTVQVL